MIDTLLASYVTGIIHTTNVPLGGVFFFHTGSFGLLNMHLVAAAVTAD